MPNPSWLQSRRQEAWAFGREQRDRLLREYEQKYHPTQLPPPAIIIRELITDFLDARLRYERLPADRFAETRLEDGRITVVLNDDIGAIAGVKDKDGVGNVALWHESMHVICDSHMLVAPASQQLPGFESPPAIVCYRRAGNRPSPGAKAIEREFWAEEAGRAAAVSHEALQRAEPFRELLRRAARATGPVRGGFPLLYDAAKAIGVNISALVKQLELEGQVVVERKDGRSDVFVQPTLLSLGRP